MWKKKSVDTAINYYKKALEIEPKNKTSLRSLSMIIRTKETDSIEEKENCSRKFRLCQKGNIFRYAR